MKYFLLILTLIIFPVKSFCQEVSVSEIEKLVYDVEQNTFIWSYAISEGYILKKRKKIGYSYLTVRNEDNEIVAILEYIADKIYTSNEYYFINQKLVYIKHSEEKHRRKKVEIINKCHIYIDHFENNIGKCSNNGIINNGLRLYNSEKDI